GYRGRVEASKGDLLGEGEDRACSAADQEVKNPGLGPFRNSVVSGCGAAGRGTFRAAPVQHPPSSTEVTVAGGTRVMSGPGSVQRGRIVGGLLRDRLGCASLARIDRLDDPA